MESNRDLVGQPGRDLVGTKDSNPNTMLEFKSWMVGKDRVEKRRTLCSVSSVLVYKDVIRDTKLSGQ